MGRYYALAAGEEPALPTRSSSTTSLASPAMHFRRASRPVGPLSPTSYDTIVGIYRRGLAPTGSAIPTRFAGLRSACCRMVLGGLRLKLDEAIAAALAGYDGVLELDVDAVARRCGDFVLGSSTCC